LTVTLPLWWQGLYFGTVVVGKPPLCTLSSWSSSMLGRFSPWLQGCDPLVDFCIPDIAVGHIPDLYAGPPTLGQVIRLALFLHNTPTGLGRHIYIYAGTLHNVFRLCRHSWILAGIRLICRPGRYSYMPARPNLGQQLQSQPLISYLSSLLTLPGVISPDT
jgi:hypothetical protein